MQSLKEKNNSPVKMADGSIENFTLRISGKPYRCACLCNVFHKPNNTNQNLYECNACGSKFEAE